MKIGSEAFKKIKQRWKDLDADFEGFRSKAQDIQRFVCPWRGRFLAGESEQEARGELYDDSNIHNTLPFRAVKVAAAGIKNGVSPASRPWFKITSEDEKAAEMAGPSRWLSHVEKLLYLIAQRSNTYDGFQECDTENVVFGTCSSLVLPDYTNVLHMKPMTFGEYRLGVDFQGRVNSFAWKFYKRVGNLVDEFGKTNCSQAVQTLYEGGHLEKMVLCYGLIEPNDDRYDVNDALGRAFRVIYWEQGGLADEILSVRGFDSFPDISAGWEKVGSAVYGIGPGHENLRNCKRLQKFEEDRLQNLALVNKPPLFSDDANKNTLINAGPWGITRGSDPSASTRPGVRPLYEVKAFQQELIQSIQDCEKAISDGFYNDIFMMISNQAESIETAYQAARMMEEKYAVLGPVTERALAMRGQWIQLAFAYALDAGLVTEAPPELQGQDLKIEYISILAQAQKIAGLGAINDTMAFVSTAAQIWPEARFKFDAMQAVDEVAHVNGVPPSVIRSDEDANALFAQEMKAQQAAAQGQAALAATEGARNLKDVEMGGRSAVDVLAGAA